MPVLFFLRHNNDIDHISPVIYKWSQSGHRCHVILLGKRTLINDFRIQFLIGLEGVNFTHIGDLISRLSFFLWRLQTLLLVRSSHISVFGPAIRFLTKIIDHKKRRIVWRHTARKILTHCFDGHKKGVVVFDWIERNSGICVEWVEVVISEARQKKLGTVSLPHGDSPHVSQLIRSGEWVLEPDTSFSAAGMFDKVVVPNEPCSRRFISLMNKDKIEILGSPRYCDEWLAKLKEIFPPSPLTRQTDCLKIVLFLRKERYTTFWEELAEVIQLIAAFPKVQLIVQPHTRGGWKQPLTKNKALGKLSNVIMADGTIPSVHLLNWADIIIDIATSIVYQAIKEGKPVLSADYTHAGQSASAYFMPETEIKCRDGMYKAIDSFIKNGTHLFYCEKHRQRFIAEMIETNGPDVLSGYVSLLEKAHNINT